MRLPEASLHKYFKAPFKTARTQYRLRNNLSCLPQKITAGQQLAGSEKPGDQGLINREYTRTTDSPARRGIAAFFFRKQRGEEGQMMPNGQTLPAPSTKVKKCKCRLGSPN